MRTKTEDHWPIDYQLPAEHEPIPYVLSQAAIAALSLTSERDR